MTLEQVLTEFLPALITIIPVVVLMVRNQANAQAILNRQYEEALSELKQVRKELAEAKEQFAYERGQLIERVAQMDKALKEERDRSEAREKERNTLMEQVQRLKGELDALRKAAA